MTSPTPPPTTSTTRAPGTADWLYFCFPDYEKRLGNYTSGHVFQEMGEARAFAKEEADLGHPTDVWAIKAVFTSRVPATTWPEPPTPGEDGTPPWEDGQPDDDPPAVPSE